MPRFASSVLPVAHVVLRVLVVVNWLGGAAIATLLIAMPTSRWIRTALGVPPAADARGLIIGMQAIAALGLVAIPLNYVVLKRLLEMVQTVRANDPFAAANGSFARTV